jgi:hypothetical protein
MEGRCLLLKHIRERLVWNCKIDALFFGVKVNGRFATRLL